MVPIKLATFFLGMGKWLLILSNSSIKNYWNKNNCLLKFDLKFDIIFNRIVGYFAVIIYATLQARSIGLSFNDISIVLGLLPIISALANPLLGKTWTYN